jgi:hypothetical protein
MAFEQNPQIKNNKENALPKASSFSELTWENFLDDVPTSGWLWQGERIGFQERLVVFKQILENFQKIGRGFGAMTKEKQEEFLARMPAIKQEANFLSKKTGIDFNSDYEQIASLIK